MHDVDRPAHVQALAQPPRSRRPRADAEPLRLVPRPERLDGIVGYRSERRHLGQESPVRAPEPEHAVGLSIHLVALLMDRAVVPAAYEHEVRERRRAALRPVAEVMALAEREPAAGKAAPLVSVVERPPKRRRNGPGAGADLDDLAIRGVPHHHAARVARQAPGRFRGNVRAVLEDGLAGRVRVREHRGLDMDDHLVPLPRGAGIDPVMEGRLREQGQRVRASGPVVGLILLGR